MKAMIPPSDGPISSSSSTVRTEDIVPMRSLIVCSRCLPLNQLRTSMYTIKISVPKETCISSPLVKGLSRLDGLESVSLEGSWAFSVRKSRDRDRGTPLARRWNSFPFGPHRWPWDTVDNGLRAARWHAPPLDHHHCAMNPQSTR